MQRGVVRGPQCGCRQLPDTKKIPSDRHHPYPHCAATYGRDDNATRGVVRRWMEAQLSGRELSAVWSGGGFTADRPLPAMSTKLSP